MNVFVFLGPAGSGKGTQAQYLKNEHMFYHLSTGDMLRDEVASKSKLGLRLKEVIDSGNLVTDDIILDIISSNISKIVNDSHYEGIVFDGFPRTIAQANGFKSILDNYKLNVDQTFLFDLSLEASLDRISGRRIDPRNNTVYHILSNPAPDDVKKHLILRDDDQPEKVSHRYKLYQEQTAPLIDYYTDSLTKINCELSIQDIYAQFDQHIKLFQQKV